MWNVTMCSVYFCFSARSVHALLHQRKSDTSGKTSSNPINYCLGLDEFSRLGSDAQFGTFAD